MFYKKELRKLRAAVSKPRLALVERSYTSRPFIFFMSFHLKNSRIVQRIFTKFIIEDFSKTSRNFQIFFETWEK